MLCNADGGVPGGVGSTLTVPIPAICDYSDGTLSAGESFDVDFEIGLVTGGPFDVLVDLHAVVVP